MQDKEGFSKVMNVWKLENKILNPNSNKLAFEIVDQIASLFSTGSFYYFITNFVTYKMDFVNEGTLEVLGIEPDQFSVEKFFSLLHPEDLAKIHEKELTGLNFFKNNIAKEDIPLYKVVYLVRLRHTNGTYKTILHQSKAITMSKGGNIQQAVGVHTDVTYLNIPFDHKISLISTQRPSYYAIEISEPYSYIENTFSTVFTKREKEIIKIMSEGKNFNEIAELLFVSPHTIKTHKKNILRKAQCRNASELITKCLREGVI
jgi:DNA-binding CsgD family transcriptional regulator